MPLAFFQPERKFQKPQRTQVWQEQSNTRCQIGQAKIITVDPPTGSCPIVAIKRPIKTDIHPFQMVRAYGRSHCQPHKILRVKISGGPILRIAQFASGSVTVIITALKPCRRWPNREQPHQLPYPDWPFWVMG